jgi:ribosome recycling factor
MTDWKKDLESRMEGALNVLTQEFNGLRTGRASTDLLAPVTVEAYGSNTPLNQVGTVNVADTRTLSIQVWDATLIPAVEKAVRDSGLGLNPMTEGNVVRLNLPEITEERRVELSKVAKKYAENARVSIRNVRRDGMDTIKKQEKDGELTEDQVHNFSDEVQKITDNFVSKVDQALQQKEQDIMQV